MNRQNIETKTTNKIGKVTYEDIADLNENAIKTIRSKPKKIVLRQL